MRSEEWGNVLIELDRREYNVNRRETRRHTSLDNGNADGEWLTFDQEYDGILESKEISNKVRTASNLLKPKQRDLI